MQDCVLGSAKCVVFQCALQKFSGSAKFTIKARLWNSTFIEVYYCYLLSYTTDTQSNGTLLLLIHISIIPPTGVLSSQCVGGVDQSEHLGEV